ncbi:MAG TPA: sigma-70 family RNA polymerase sigma factor [Fluviicola sp.]|nr:sigma-70 family RNA polymerase sigma factor [Fluviicola sp.]
MEKILNKTNLQETQLKALYKKWPEIKRFLVSLGCTKNDAEDVFQEALVIYIRKCEQPDFVLTVEPFFYVRNTCKLLWYNQSRKQGRQQTFSLETDVAQLDDDWFRKETQIRTIEQALTQLGKQCQELLQLFYGLGWSMTDIAAKIGLRNDKVAKAQKYRCLQKAKELVQDPSAEINVEPEILKS